MRFWSTARRRAATASFMITALAFAGNGALAADRPEVTLAQGTLIGTAGAGLMHFMGVRYAEAPTGNLRWMPPVLVAAGTGTVDAGKPGAACPQAKSPWGFPSSNEDCLFLNLTVPGAAADMGFWERKPVMVFFHGGGFSGGSGDLYNADALAREGDVIVVTVNFRLGALGEFAHPALDAEDHVGGNYGLLDQLQSLRWVRDNIAKFGGDPNNVTVFGESSGAIGIYTEIASPLAAGLFQKAIIESGAPADESLATAEGQGKTLAQKVGCPTDATPAAAACLRQVPVDKLVGAEALPIATIVDGKLLPEPIEAALKDGHYNHIPVISGTNHDEGNLFAAFMFDLSGAPLKAADYDRAIGMASDFIARVGYPKSEVPAVRKEYPVAAYKAPGLAAAQLMTDGLVACPAVDASAEMARFAPVYEYEQADENAPSIVAPPISFPYHAAHFSELQYIFDLSSITIKGTPPLTADEQAMAREMRAYWANFARTGDPNGRGLPRWPAVDGRHGPVQSLRPVGTRPIKSFSRAHRCGFWAGLMRQ
jgi:para-nitrobenzyl esterase